MSTLQALLLADFAQVREGLLFVVSGGIDALYRPTLPAPLGASVAGILELGPDEAEVVHEIRLKITCEGDVLATDVLGVQQQMSGHEPRGYCPLVKFAGRPAAELDRYGLYDLTAYVNGEEQKRLSFYVAPPPQR